MTASNQPSESEIGTLFALFKERIAIGGAEWNETTFILIWPDGLGEIANGGNSLMTFSTHAEAISKLRAAIEAAAPKPVEVSEPDGKFYVQVANEETGIWERMVSTRGYPICYRGIHMANDWVTFAAKRNPGISFRLTDSNGKPLSIALTVSSELSADELSKLGALDIDRIYEGK